jgi:hypothetical protein
MANNKIMSHSVNLISGNPGSDCGARGFDCSSGNFSGCSYCLNLRSAIDITTTVGFRFSLSDILRRSYRAGNESSGSQRAGDKVSVRVFRHAPSLNKRGRPTWTTHNGGTTTKPARLSRGGNPSVCTETDPIRHEKKLCEPRRSRNSGRSSGKRTITTLSRRRSCVLQRGRRRQEFQTSIERPRHKEPNLVGRTV